MGQRNLFPATWQPTTECHFPAALSHTPGCHSRHALVLQQHHDATPDWRCLTRRRYHFLGITYRHYHHWFALHLHDPGIHNEFFCLAPTTITACAPTRGIAPPLRSLFGHRFCTSPIASAALVSFQHDFAGRYATPLMLVLPFFFATAITSVTLRLYETSLSHSTAIDDAQRERGTQDKMLDAEKEGHFTEGGGGRNQSVPTVVARIVQGMLFVLLLLALGLQVASYGMVNPATTFQSPSCPMAPANDDPIITYLQQEHVHYAWAIPWIGSPITFKTNAGIITADPRPVINFMGLTRIVAYLRDVSLANRPALLTFVRHNDPRPLLLRILDTRHITYRAAYFPSQPGIDVLVVTRLSRTLSLYESKYLQEVFTPCI